MSASTAALGRGRRAAAVCAVLLAGMVLAAIWSLKSGILEIGWGRMARALCGAGDADVMLVWTKFRLPRIVMAVLVGMGLSVSGALLQGITRNDLATPGILGIIGGGNLAVVLAVLTAGRMLHPVALPAASFVGAALTLGLVILLSGRGAMHCPERMLLTGIAVSTALGAAISVISMFLPMMMFDYVTAWLSCSLARASWRYDLLLLPWIAVLLPLCWLYADSLNVMSLGDEVATGLGVRLVRTRFVLVLIAVGLAAPCVAVGGSVMFLGLLAPHIARRLVGTNYRYVLPVAALAGSFLLLSADVVGRIIVPLKELPAGLVVTALGGPYFLYLLARR